MQKRKNIHWNIGIVSERWHFLMNAVFFVLLFSSCEKNITTQAPELPFNPFDTITYNQSIVPTVPPDSSSFAGIHQYILSVKCAVNGCHDGTFEPEYRTVQSAYNTLVLAPVLKNTEDSSFTYRVVPYDTTNSWLWYRLNTNDATLGRMPLYDTLYPAQREKISQWIMNGAPDLFGNSPSIPNYQPTLYGIVAYLPDQNNYRVDTLRGGITTNPFMVTQHTNVKIWIGIYDDITLPFQFTYNKVKFSTDPFNWDDALEVPLQSQLIPHMEQLFAMDLPFYLYCTVNTSAFELNDIVYIRTYVEDEDHSSPTQIPEDGSQIYIQTYCSFIVQ
ncbi:MAG TPA: hypothetical protein PLD84_10495 [Chitinophagales bacterium]|nr:hypothetical protein [Chitinophagales bacterium]